MKANNISGNNNNDRHPLADRWSEAVEYEKTRNELGRLIHQKAQKKRRINRWIGYSAAASIVVAFGLFGIFRPFTPDPEKENASLLAAHDTSGSGSKDTSKTLIFNEEHPRKYASRAAVGSESLSETLISPNDSAAFNRSDRISFRWMALVNQSVLKICSYPEDSIAISNSLQKSDTFYILNGKKLKPGWYRWSVQPGTNSRKFLVTK